MKKMKKKEENALRPKGVKDEYTYFCQLRIKP